MVAFVDNTCGGTQTYESLSRFRRGEIPVADCELQGLTDEEVNNNNIIIIL